MAKRKQPVAEPDDTLVLRINTHTLTGERVAGVWVWDAPDFPRLAEQYSGAAGTEGILTAFVRAALATSLDPLRRAMKL